MPNYTTKEIYAELYNRIILKQYPPNYHLVEEVIAEEFCTSRSPVRNALQKLCDNGFVAHYPSRGFYVLMSNENRRVLHEIRSGLDSAAVLLLVERGNEQDIKSLTQLGIETDMVGVWGDPRESNEAEKNFHRNLVKCSGSQLLIEFWQYIEPYMSYALVLQRRPRDMGLKTNLHMHELICRSIELARAFSTPGLAEQAVVLHYSGEEGIFTDRTEQKLAEQSVHTENSICFSETAEDNPFAKKVELIYQRLFNDIISGELAVGQRINEARLANELSCSRITVRSAVERLEKDGYVEIIRNKGAVVQNVNPENHSDLLWARYCIEPVASMLCAHHMTGGECTQLLSIVKEGREAYRNQDYLGSLKADTKFHDHIVRCCRNSIVQGLYAIIAKRAHYERCMLRDSHAKDSAVWSDHYIIYRAIKDRNDRVAFVTMKTHMRRIYGV